ncbi:MAG: succinate--CoA ligase subunit alpha [bacterium]
MAILLDEDTNVIVQGITGREGVFHSERMLDYGTRLVGGVTPGKEGDTVHDKPVFDDVKTAIDETGAEASVIYVPPPFAADAIQEAAESGIELIVCITEGIPVQDMIKVRKVLEETGARLIGPNCPGVISPGKAKIGIMPGKIHLEGNVGLISRSGTLTYEIVNELTEADQGQSTAIGVGGDPIVGSRFADLLPLYEDDPDTDAVVLIGEIGGDAEQVAASYYESDMDTPVVAFIAGRSAPEGKRMGHAGAIISGEEGTAEAKIDAFEEVGIPVADYPSEVPGLIQQSLN